MGDVGKWAEKLDSRWGIPRHANSQAMPAYQAFWHFVGDVTAAITTIVCGLLSALFLSITANMFEISFQTRFFFWLGMGFLIVLGIGEAASMQIPYMRVYQLTTYGSARWAILTDLLNCKLAIRESDSIPPGWLVIGRFKRKYLIALPPATWLRHMIIFGPPGAGKSKTFFMWFIRYILRGGSVVTIDPKGELYEQSAHYARKAFRLDLKNPEYSDRWNFVPRCKKDPEFAHAMAAMMIGLEHTQQTKQDPFWGDSEHVACTAILMFLGTIIDNPTPPMVYEYVSLRDDNGFREDMANCDDYNVQLAWNAFQKAPKQTQGSIMIGLSNKLHPFFLENVQSVCAPITATERQAGVREIDFAELREPGTAIYVVIPEGAATRYKSVLSTFTGQAVQYLRDSDKGGTKNPTMFLIDEAYNVPVSDIKQVSGVGRERGIGLCLCYHNIAQVHDQYGRDGGNAILQTLVNKIFLPGLNDDTAKYASTLLGQTTTVSHTTVDAPGTKNDNLRASETGRALRDPSEIRTMLEHTQALLVTGTVPPVKFAYPQIAVEEHIAVPPKFGKPVIISLVEAQKETFKRRGTRGAEGKAEAGEKALGQTDRADVRSERPGDNGGGESKSPRKRPEIQQTSLFVENAIRENVHDALDKAESKVGSRTVKVIRKTVGVPETPNRDDMILNQGAPVHDARTAPGV